MADLDQLLNARGIVSERGAHVTHVAFSRAGTAGFALGDGHVVQLAGATWQDIAAHDGAVLGFAPDPGANAFCTGGDDGKLRRVGLDGTVTEIASFGSKWVEHVASFAGKGALIAAAAGKMLRLFDAKGEMLREFTHPSTVTGIAFDAKGKRVACSHYNGATLWFTGSGSEAKKLEWKGSHIGVVIHPAGDALVTAMQENALHGWTLPEGKHMRMAGYPAKTESMGFTQSGRWLATGGADTVVLWPFFGGGPMGKAPMELGAGDGIVKRIACHPDHEVVAAGFDTGLLLIVDIAREQVLPVCGPGHGGVSALAWDASGARLAFGTESGFVGVVDLASR